MDLRGLQARTPGEGESHVGALRAGLQGAGGGQKTRAGETLCRLICSDLLVESAVESTGRRKPGGYSIEQQEPQRPPDWESWREQRARYLKALSFLRGAVSRKPTLGPSVQHRGPAALVC